MSNNEKIKSAINTLEGLSKCPQLALMHSDFAVALEALSFLDLLESKPSIPVGAEEKAAVLEGLAFMNIDHLGGVA